MFLLFLKSSHIIVYLLGKTLQHLHPSLEYISVSREVIFVRILLFVQGSSLPNLGPPICRPYPIVEKVALEFWTFLFCWWWCKEIRFRSSRHWWCYLNRFIWLWHLCRHGWSCLNRGLNRDIHLIFECKKPI